MPRWWPTILLGWGYGVLRTGDDSGGHSSSRPAVGLSVIVTSYNSPERLALCLEAVTRQPDATEIIVADCSTRDPSGELAKRFPSVQFLRFSQKKNVPQMRWAAFRRTSESLVAAVESRCVPAPDWCSKLVEAHRNFPEAPGIGGPVLLATPASRTDVALYFSEYGLYLPPIHEGPSPDLSGANLSYKRKALEEHAGLLDAGAWETILHQRWQQQGRQLVLCGAAVTFGSSMNVRTILRQRYAYGRGYADDRVRQRNWLLRPVFAGFSLLLPLLLTWRLGMVAFHRRKLRQFLGALGWILVFEAAWAAGECTGYLFGGSAEVSIF